MEQDDAFIRMLEWKLLASCAIGIIGAEGGPNVGAASDAVEESYKALINAFNPELEIEEERREEAIRRSIEEEVKQGPFVVRPLPGFDRNDTNVPGKVGRLIRAVQSKITKDRRSRGQE